MKSNESHIQRMYAKVWFLNKPYFEVFMAVTSQLSEGTTVYFPLQFEIMNCQTSLPHVSFIYLKRKPGNYILNIFETYVIEQLSLNGACVT